MKRLYFLLSVAAMQVLIGSLLMLQAAQPIRLSQELFMAPGEHYAFGFSVLGSGRVMGNLSERQGRPFDVFVFNARGYASFRDGSNAVPPVFQESGTGVQFELQLPGSDDYYLVATDLPPSQLLQVHLELIVFGLKPIETIVALIVLAGGLALVGATLTLSIWSGGHAPPASGASIDSSMDPASDPAPLDPPAAADPPDDKTRIY